MRKKFILTSLVLLAIACFLITSWITIINENYIVKWRHITALALFIPLPILLFRRYNLAVLGTGIYLLLGLFRVITLTAGISTGSLGIGGIEISGFNWLCLGLFILFLILHLDILIDMQLDYKERRAKGGSS
jgi:hypothetical protein